MKALGLGILGALSLSLIVSGQAFFPTPPPGEEEHYLGATLLIVLGSVLWGFLAGFTCPGRK